MQNTWKIVGIVLIVVLALFLLGGAGMMGLGYGGMMGGYGGMLGGYGYNPLWWILSLGFRGLVLIGIVLFIIWLVRNAKASTASSATAESVLDILKTRYAKGELSKDQFDAMKKDLGV